MKACYIHIPFCDNICSYCDFPKMLNLKQYSMLYLKALKQEIYQSYQGEILKTLYIGGGTPSALSIEELEYLFKKLSVIQLDEIYEYTFEANPENLTKEKLFLLKKYGVNRLSIGIQTFNDELLTILNRKHRYKDIIEVITTAKEVGFNNINIDLIYGLPNQTLNDVIQDVALFLDLDVPHISTYSLILEDHTLFKIKGIKQCDEDLELMMYDYIIKQLKNNGYIHYEISNFAKKGFESKHNLNYWDNAEYYGFGLGAHGYVNGIRYANTRSINDYLKYEFRIEENKLTTNQKIEETMFLGLRKQEGINLDLFKEQYKKDIYEIYPFIDDLINQDLIKINNNYLALTEHGLKIGNIVFEKFLLD